MEAKNANSITEGTISIIRKTYKDSVFRDLFIIPKYLLELYRVIKPEDTTAAESDLGSVTISNVLLDRMYNDLAFTVRGKLLVLVEAQSTWTVNIIVRIFLYFAEIWKTYINVTGQDVYSSKKINLPEPDFYVIYTGNNSKRPVSLKLSDEFLPSKLGNKEQVDAKVKEQVDAKLKEAAEKAAKEATKKFAVRLHKMGFSEESISNMIPASRAEVALWTAGVTVSA